MNAIRYLICGVLSVAFVMPGTVQAQGSASIAERYADLRQEVARLQDGCDYAAYRALSPQIDAFAAEVARIVEGGASSGSKPADPRQYEEAIEVYPSVDGLRVSLDATCDPAAAFEQVKFAHETCYREGRLDGLRALDNLIVRARNELQGVRAGQGPDGLTLATAQRRLDLALDYRKQADALEWDCGAAPRPERAPEPVDKPSPDSPAETVQAPSPEAADPCGVEPGQYDPCAGARPLLGTWTNPRFGGVIEFYMESDETIGARIVGLSERMRDRGFVQGMQIARGLRVKPTGGTWSFFASDGESFSPVHPDARPTDILGQARWLPNAAVFIEVARPGILNLPPALEGPLSDYDEWQRSGTRTR